jgi:hypothetical protein
MTIIPTTAAAATKTVKLPCAELSTRVCGGVEALLY